jgi:hypothetical protein
MSNSSYLNSKTNVVHILFSIYSISAIAFSIYFVEPALDPQSIITTRLWADSQDYMRFSEYYENDAWTNIPINLIGPSIVGILLNHNNLNIVLLNNALIWVAYFLMVKHLNFNQNVFLMFLMINPMFFISLTNLNKEIFSLASIMIFFIRPKSIVLFISFQCLSFLTAFFARWIHVLVYFAYWAFYYFKNKKNLFFRESGIRFLFLTILIISVMYPIFSYLLADTYDFVEESSDFVKLQTEASGGINLILKEMDSHFLFFIALIPKIFFNYFGNFLRIFDIILGSDKTPINDIYNKYIVLGHQLSMILVITIAALLKVKLDFNKNNLFLIGLYTIICCTSSLINSRIFFPVYGIISFVIASDGNLLSQGNSHVD